MLDVESWADLNQAYKGLNTMKERSIEILKYTEVEDTKHRVKRINTGMVKRKDQVIRDLIRKIKRTYKRCFYNATEYLNT